MDKLLIVVFVCGLLPVGARARVVTAVAGAPRQAAPFRSQGRRLHWNEGRLVLRFSNTVRLAEGEGGVDPRETVASVQGALAEAARAWAAGPFAAVRIEIETTDEQRADPARNVVTFTDPSPFDEGLCDRRYAAACTLVSFVVETGEIVGASIAFNPDVRFSSLGLDGAHAIAPVMLHETGHALGLGHSALLHAAMNPFVESAAPDAFTLQELAEDDLLSLAETYPAAGAASLLARVTGVVTLDGSPAAGAHVIAVAEDGTPVRGVLTGAHGEYSMTLAPGACTLLVEPLDGPVVAGHFGLPAAAPFPTLFWAASGLQPREGEALALEAEASVTADFALNSAPVANLRRVAVVDAQGASYVYRIDLPRGGRYLLSAIRDPMAGVPDLWLSAPAIFLDGDTVIGPDPDLAERWIEIPADAPPGVFNLYYHDGAAGALLAGAVRVTLRPEVTGVQLTEDGLGVLIAGTDLALVEAGTDAGADAPTQLGGVSVRLGDRFAPLVSVAPGEIRAAIPAGVGPGPVEVTVVAGTRARSVPVTVDLP